MHGDRASYFSPCFSSSWGEKTLGSKDRDSRLATSYSTTVEIIASAAKFASVHSMHVVA